MKYRVSAVWLIVLLIVVSAMAQVDLTGKVLDEDSKPVEGVVAILEGLGLTDTTGADGVYHFSITGIKDLSNKGFQNKVENSRLLFSIDKKQTVLIDIFDLSGKKVSSVLNELLNGGVYSIKPGGYDLASKIYIIRLLVGKSASYYKMLNVKKEKGMGLTRLGSGWDNIITRSPQQCDTLRLRKRGQTIARSEVTNLVDTLANIFIIQRDISGDLGGHDSISKIEAVLTGDYIPDSLPKLVELWHNTANQSYSGFIYFLHTVNTINYNIFVKVYDAEGRFIGRSMNVPFSDMAGDIEVPMFDIENAKPMVSLGHDTIISIYDTLVLKAIVSDQFRGRSIAKYEWDINGNGFSEGSEDTAIVAPDSVNRSQIVTTIKVTDIDGNVATDTLVVTVVQDIPIAVASIIALEFSWAGDSITLKGDASDNYGYIKKWEWDFGNGFIETSLSDTGVFISNTGNNMFILRVTDDDNNVDLDTVDIDAFGMSGQMSFIPAKEVVFYMGSPRLYPLAQHKVSFTYNFFMDTTEVTQADYESVMGVNPSILKNPNAPVDNMDWFDAVLYCNLRSKAAGFDTVYIYTAVEGVSGDTTHNLVGISIDITKNGYRLPMEAEWEFAYYGTFDTHMQDYYWDGDLDGDYLWYKDNSNDSAHVVGTKLPNGFRLYNMAGNVSELISDWWEEKYTVTGEITVDPTGPEVGEWGRCVRGASYMYSGDGDYHAGWFRPWGMLPYCAYTTYGFRTVRTAE